MNCSQVYELISEAVDHRLSGDVMREFEAHLSKCGKCLSEFKAEEMIKSVLQYRLPRAVIPSEVYNAVVGALAREQQSQQRSWFASLLGSPILNPAVAFVLVITLAVGVYSLFSTSSPKLPNDKNIISQSIKNYAAVIAGNIKPKIMSHDAGDVENYFKKDVSFDVSVAPTNGCDWCGGALSEFHGVKFAHIVYKFGGEHNVLYVYQTDLEEAMKGEKIGLPAKAKDALKKTGWYFEEKPGKYNLVMWKQKHTLCTAVSTMGRQKMIAFLTGTGE
ncbi:MAG: zf-HC2 domain-containing protein [Bacteroidota bacterium]|nr:zf-HC2 domain-containing protein [Bacteroidota bacterium]